MVIGHAASGKLLDFGVLDISLSFILDRYRSGLVHRQGAGIVLLQNCEALC
jgi:hypothetical protein